jgi:hypothetical protein
LEQGEVVFGGVRELLDEQFDRLSALEQSVFCWLAILREQVSLGELRALLVAPRPSGEVLEAVDGLLRRSLIERGKLAGSFTLQSVVLEYMTTRLIAEASRELEQGRLVRLIEHGLVQAHAKDYVRQAQERLQLAPLLTRSQSASQEHDREARVNVLLDQVRTWSERAQGYGPANLLALLRELRGHLRGLDLSQLFIRGAYLQGVEMQDTTLAGAVIQESIFTESFDAINGVAISSTGEYWAASSRRGEVRMWEAGGQTLHRIWQAHTERAWSLAFSPDGRIWPAEAGTAWSSCGRWRAAPWSGQAGIRAILIVWPLPPMGVCSPAVGLMKRFSGRSSAARRRKPSRILIR